MYTSIGMLLIIRALLSGVVDWGDKHAMLGANGLRWGSAREGGYGQWKKSAELTPSYGCHDLRFDDISNASEINQVEDRSAIR